MMPILTVRRQERYLSNFEKKNEKEVIVYYNHRGIEIGEDGGQ